MSLISIRWEEGKSVQVKEAIRADICEGVGADLGVAPEFIAVLFDDHPHVDVTHHGAFVFVYLTEGRDDDCKDSMVAHITDAICTHTGCDAGKVNIMLVDILRGSMATKGKIVNRGGAVADLMRKGTLDKNELL